MFFCLQYYFNISQFSVPSAIFLSTNLNLCTIVSQICLSDTTIQLSCDQLIVLSILEQLVTFPCTLFFLPISLLLTPLCSILWLLTAYILGWHSGFRSSAGCYSTHGGRSLGSATQGLVVGDWKCFFSKFGFGLFILIFLLAILISARSTRLVLLNSLAFLHGSIPCTLIICNCVIGIGCSLSDSPSAVCCSVCKDQHQSQWKAYRNIRTYSLFIVASLNFVLFLLFIYYMPFGHYFQCATVVIVVIIIISSFPKILR